MGQNQPNQNQNQTQPGTKTQERTEQRPGQQQTGSPQRNQKAEDIDSSEQESQ